MNYQVKQVLTAMLVLATPILLFWLCGVADVLILLLVIFVVLASAIAGRFYGRWKIVAGSKPTGFTGLALVSAAFLFLLFQFVTKTVEPFMMSAHLLGVLGFLVLSVWAGLQDWGKV